MLDWDDLRYFLAVAREGSLSAAARSLRLAQPTMGRRISAFEARLGAKLFVATPSGQALSATGRRILGHAEQMERDALAAEHIASGRDRGLSGSVCITASEWMVQRVLAPALAPFIARHQELQIELLAETRHLSLVRREADLAVRPSKFENPEIVPLRLGSIGFGLYASDAYLSQFGAPEFERQCEGQQLIAMSAALTKVPDVTWLATIASRARIVARSNGREPMVLLASAGLGLACLPRYIGDATSGLRYVRTPNPAPLRPLWLGVHRDARAVPRVKACTEHLMQSLERLQHALNPPEVGA